MLFIQLFFSLFEAFRFNSLSQFSEAFFGVPSTNDWLDSSFAGESSNEKTVGDDSNNFGQ